MKGFTYSQKTIKDQTKIYPKRLSKSVYSVPALSYMAPLIANGCGVTCQVTDKLTAKIMPRGKTYLRMQKLGWKGIHR